jgi:hypothetical protein
MIIALRPYFKEVMYGGETGVLNSLYWGCGIGGVRFIAFGIITWFKRGIYYLGR